MTEGHGELLREFLSGNSREVVRGVAHRGPTR